MKFKVGDKVVCRTNNLSGSMVSGAEYTVDETTPYIWDGYVCLVGHDGRQYRAENFDLVKEEKPMFNKGDNVIRTGCSLFHIVRGDTYIVEYFDPDTGRIALKGISGSSYAPAMFELAPEQPSKLTPHIHAKEIKAWADGATIQCYQNVLGNWGVGGDNPSWNPNFRYRVKPDDAETELLKAKVEIIQAELDALKAKL
tara:strand:- start:7283 stop:7876 length:594 start_codon:yes stop_codon:yes gene_type:complete